MACSRPSNNIVPCLPCALCNCREVPGGWFPRGEKKSQHEKPKLGKETPIIIVVLFHGHGLDFAFTARCCGDSLCLFMATCYIMIKNTTVFALSLHVPAFTAVRISPCQNPTVRFGPIPAKPKSYAYTVRFGSVRFQRNRAYQGFSR